MKYILSSILLSLSLQTFASMDVSEAISKTSSEEISANRACFQELEAQGCRTPDEDPKHFRACLKNSLPALTSNCKKMVSDLYEAK